jgi:hypothetical protein
MTTKNHFIMLSLIISGQESVTDDNVDVYLEPLLEELQQLWHEGVQVCDDASNYNGMPIFTLKAILMRCMHDFLAYGIMANCVTKGYHAHLICGPQTDSCLSRSLSKNVYCNQHCRWLPMDHPFRESAATFDGVHEAQMAPPRVAIDDIIRWGSMKNNFLSNGGHP